MIASVELEIMISFAGAHWFSLFFSTFLLEDVALAAAIILVNQNSISLLSGFSSIFLGICIGDILLFWFGRLIAKNEFFNQLKYIQKVRNFITQSKYKTLLDSSVIFSRFIPGTRLITYLSAGYFSYSFPRFLIITIVTVLVWVAALFGIGTVLKPFLTENLLISFFVILALLFLVKKIIFFVQNPHRFKSFLISWKKWTSFEFWPSWFFYIPIIPRYFYLSLKYRSFLLPFYANPQIPHAGLIGESKWDFYKHIQTADASLKTVLIKYSSDLKSEVYLQIEKNNYKFPYILKPDLGQRGFGVRIIENQSQLDDYLKFCDFDLLIQEYCAWPNEAGVFYYRYPNAPKGEIFSITDKSFPYLVGDGVNTLSELILKDPRASIIANTYFDRFNLHLKKIPEKNEKVFISSCGNHCQGAQFYNGKDLITKELLAAIEALTSQIPDFYFGRFDVRYLSKSDLKNGNHFKIVEVNGAGSEATHIWDSKTLLIEAYKVLYLQWEILFKIGYQIKESKKVIYPFNLTAFIKDIFYMKKHNKHFLTSS